MAAITAVDAVLCGTGEYTTGFVHGGGSKSDKKMGVVGLCMFEMRRLGLVKRIALAGTGGTKFPAIRDHLKSKISDYYAGLDVSCDTYPADTVERDPEAYRAAIDKLAPGSLVTIFTPDPTHFPIAQYAIEKGMHVLVTKPAVMTLDHHRQLVRLAERHKVLVMVEFHKRWDPVYLDARAKARTYGDCSYFYGFMSQPKFQLETFKSWAGISSDISYYLNSHHIDVHAWMLEGCAVPVSVTASAATGVAESPPYNCPKGAEDTITLLVQWKSASTGFLGTAVYTSSWAAPKADVHSQQRFHYMGHKGEIMVDQAHRGYTVCTDADGFASVNPMYMSYMPGPDGHFNGHRGYGYLSVEAFVTAALEINAGRKTAADYDAVLPTMKATAVTTAILEGGRLSLDRGGVPVAIELHEGEFHLK